jgi:hypothetical protein
MFLVEWFPCQNVLYIFCPPHPSYMSVPHNLTVACCTPQEVAERQHACGIFGKTQILFFNCNLFLLSFQAFIMGMYLLTYGAEPFLRSCQLCSPSRTPQHFMEPEGSIPRSQEPSTGPYPEPYQFNPLHPILSDERTKCSGLNGSKHYWSSVSSYFPPESGFHLLSSVFTSRPISLLASIKVFVFIGMLLS